MKISLRKTSRTKPKTPIKLMYKKRNPTSKSEKLAFISRMTTSPESLLKSRSKELTAKSSWMPKKTLSMHEET